MMSITRPTSAWNSKVSPSAAGASASAVDMRRALPRTEKGLGGRAVAGVPAVHRECERVGGVKAVAAPRSKAAAVHVAETRISARVLELRSGSLMRRAEGRVGRRRAKIIAARGARGWTRSVSHAALRGSGSTSMKACAQLELEGVPLRARGGIRGPDSEPGLNSPSKCARHCAAVPA